MKAWVGRYGVMAIVMALAFGPRAARSEGASGDLLLGHSIHLGAPTAEMGPFRPLSLERRCGTEEDRPAGALPLAGFTMRGLGAREGDDDSEDRLGRFGSDLLVPFLIVGELTLLQDGENGREEAIQGARALLVTGLVTEALKAAVRERRPDSSGMDSFPSGHASLAFAMATVLAEYKPKSTWLAYSTATFIGVSRVSADEHHWYDVVAGAAIGCVVATHVTDKHLMLSSDGLCLCWRW